MTIGMELQRKPDRDSVFKLARLGDYVEILSGFAFDSSRFSLEGDMPLIRIRDVVRGRTETYYSGSFDERYVVRDGDLLVGMDGDFNREVWSSPPALLNQRVCRITPLDAGLDPRYLYHFLPQALMEIWHATPFATVKHLSVKAVREILLPLPAVDEQRRIANILDKADEMRAKRRQALVMLDNLIPAAFQQMFGDVRRPKPGIELAPIGSLCKLVRGSSPRPQGDPRYFGGPIPRLMIADITRDGDLVTPRIDSLTIAGAAKSRPVPAGTVVMAVSGNIGLSAILSVDACIHDGFVGFTGLDASRVEPKYLQTVLKVGRALHESGVAGAIFKNITTTDIKKTQIPVPPLQDQLTFKKLVSAVELTRITYSKQLAELDALFRSIQHRAFSGQL